jgi:hypothetical protein
MIDSLEVYIVGNPFIDNENWKNKVKNYGLKVLKEPKVLEININKIRQEDKREEKKQQAIIPLKASEDPNH